MSTENFDANSHRKQAMASSDHLNSLLLLLLLFPLLPCVLAVNETDCKRFSTSLNTSSSALLSPSGDFAFGFRDLFEDKKHFLLAIWFNKIKDKTIVWSANGDAQELAPEGSEVKLTDNGEFVLNDPRGNQLWKAATNGNRSSCVALLDVGNLVLVNKDYKPIWESFKEPNDTMLPGQMLDMGGSLVSRASNKSYSKGSFELRMQGDGNLVLYSVSIASGDTLGVTWASGSMHENQGSISQLIFDEAGDIYIKETRSQGVGKTYLLFNGKPRSTQYFYYLVRIDSDGVLRIYDHPKGTTSSCEGRLSWCIVKGIPKDICLVSGICGFNSYCVKDGNNPSGFDCLCPNGYSYLDQFDKSKGCKPDFPLPRCLTDGWEMNKENVHFEIIKNTNWPLSDYERQTGKEVNLEKCQQFCLDDCFCVAAIFSGESCWKKRYPLTRGRKSNDTGIALLKVPKGNITRLESKDKRDKSTLILPGSILLGISGSFNVLLLIAIGVALLFSYQRKLQDLQSVSSVSTTNLRRYTYKDLEDATRGFKNILGRGAFGSVYKGVLGSYPKRFVAIKKLERVENDGEKEFKTEVTVIGQTHHKNLVRLFGYCDEGDHRLLVYEYMSNGSLASFLFGISRPDLNQRVQIAFGIARGLMYLHEECSTQIIHCDIKPQNILLDDNFTPRIADFGLAKLMLAEQTRAARTNIRGTVGYFAPEWFRKASITVKVDVYSFGVMLLEIICRKSSVAFAMQNEEEDALVDWAYDCYKERRLDKLIEDDEEARNDMKRVERIVMVAIWCIQEDAALRPSMKKVSQMLEGVIPVSVPPAPSNYT